MKISAAFAISLVSTLLTVSAQANDISGVKLGMSLSEAKSAFVQPSNMKTIQVQTDGRESGFAGWRGQTVYLDTAMRTGPPDEYFAFKGKADAIWYVQRNQRLPKTERFARQTLIEAVRKKYGKESFVEGKLEEKHGAIQMGWEFSQDGKQFFGTSLNAPCQMFYPAQLGTNPLGGDNFLPDIMSIIPPTEFKRSCGRAYYVEWSYDADGLVREVAARAIDSAAMLRVIDGKKSKDEADEKQRTQQQLNKGLKPSL